MREIIPIVELIRVEESFRWGTFGVLRIQKQAFCVTLEPPDVLNQKNVSCIPAQQYLCWRIVSPNYGETYEIKDVPDRSHVLIHAGNVKENTKGCIILGQYWGKLGKDRAILNSGNTFKRFMHQMFEYDAFHLTITDNY